MAYVNAACAGRVTIFSTGGKVRPGSNFTLLHALTLATRSYALLVKVIGSADVLGLTFYEQKESVSSLLTLF